MTYFWLNGLFLQNKYFQYFDRSKTRCDRAKIGLAGQQDRPLSKNYLQPCTWMESVTVRGKSLAQERNAMTPAQASTLTAQS